MKELEYTPAEDTRFDHLMDVEYKTAIEAREIIEKERGNTLGARAVAEILEQRPKAKRVNRRGGRSYPEPSDSELDPHWNGEALLEPVIDVDESKRGFEVFAEETRAAAAISIAQTREISVEAARSIVEARRKANH